MEITSIRYTAPFGCTQTSLDELGAPYQKPSTYLWRRANKNEIQSGMLDGKEFRYKYARQYEFICNRAEWVSNKKPAIVHYKLGTTSIKDVVFYLETEQFYNTKEKVEYLAANLPNLKEVILPTTGCSLHGDIDVSFIMNDGTHYTAPYNY